VLGIVDLSLPSGKLIGILATNGAGKSTVDQKQLWLSKRPSWLRKAFDKKPWKRVESISYCGLNENPVGLEFPASSPRM